MLNLTRKFGNSIWGYRVALTAMVLTAGLSALRLAFQLGYDYHLFSCASLARLNCFISFRGSYLLGVTFALMLSAVGLTSRRVVGFPFSLVALVFLGEVYREWYVGTLSLIEMYGARSFSEMPDQQQHL